MKTETFWIGELDFQGYTLHVVSRAEKGAQDALLKEYRKQKHRDTNFKTWEELYDYFGAWVWETKLDEVIWP